MKPLIRILKAQEKKRWRFVQFVVDIVLFYLFLCVGSVLNYVRSYRIKNVGWNAYGMFDVDEPISDYQKAVRGRCYESVYTKIRTKLHFFSL